MFEKFSKINYSLNGQTLQFTDIFKSIRLNKDNLTYIKTATNTENLRSDQISNRIYQDSNLFWSIFLLNGVVNPFKDWKQSSVSQQNQFDTVYDTKTFQFGNTSAYLPTKNIEYSTDQLDSYFGVDFTGIDVNDIIVFEQGDGAFNLKQIGAGVLPSTTSISSSVCANPHYGQSYTPDNFLNKNNIKKISAGGNFTAVLDNVGRIWGWGQDIGITGFDSKGTLFNSKDSGYTLIDVTKNKIIASKGTNWYCYGSGCTSSLTYPVSIPNAGTTVYKIAFTKGNTFAGLILDSSNKITVYGGLTGSIGNTAIGITGITFTDITCIEQCCFGLITTSAQYGRAVMQFNYPGQTWAYLPSTSSYDYTKLKSIEGGNNHILLMNENGGVTGAGDNSKGQLNLPTDVVYTLVSAGQYHSVGIGSDNKIYVAGQIFKESGGCTGSTAYTNLLSPNGSFVDVKSGENHVVCLETGTNVKYAGRISKIDYDYKRIYVRGISADNFKSIYLEDPTGTIVSIINSDGIGIKKTLQHQLLSIDFYKNTPVYITNSESQIVDVVANNGQAWKNSYINNYQNAENLNTFITPDKINRDTLIPKIDYLSSLKISNLNNKITSLLQSTNKIDIKLSEI